MSRRSAFGAGLAALAAAAAPALAGAALIPGTPGAVSHVDPRFVATPDEDAWKITAPALTPAGAGAKWTMNWACLPGTEVASVEFGALHYAAASQAGFEIRSGGRLLWSTPEARIAGRRTPGRTSRSRSRPASATRSCRSCRAGPRTRAPGPGGSATRGCSSGTSRRPP